MKTIQKFLVLTIFSAVLFSCEKEPVEEAPQTCKTCEQTIDDELSRIDVCPTKATYYIDGVYVTELELDGDVSYYVQVHTGGGLYLSLVNYLKNQKQNIMKNKIIFSLITIAIFMLSACSKKSMCKTCTLDHSPSIRVEVCDGTSTTYDGNTVILEEDISGFPMSVYYSSLNAAGYECK